MDVGATVKNERSGTTFTILSIGNDYMSMRYQSESPTRVPDFPKHLHDRWDEEFEVVTGQGRYWADGVWNDISAGETIVHKANINHIHPMNSGPEPFEMIQSVKLHTPNRQEIDTTLGVLFTVMDRHANGRVRIGPHGYPVNPLYFAAIGKVLGDCGSYDGVMPVALQKGSAATLGRMAMALGVDPIDDAWR